MPKAETQHLGGSRAASHSEAAQYARATRRPCTTYVKCWLATAIGATAIGARREACNATQTLYAPCAGFWRIQGGHQATESLHFVGRSAWPERALTS